MVRSIQRVSVSAGIFVLAIITVCVSGTYDKINAQCVGTGCKIVYLQDVKISACDCPGRKVEYYKNGDSKRFTLAENWTRENGAVYNPTTKIIVEIA